MAKMGIGLRNLGIVPLRSMATGAMGTYTEKVMGYGPIAYWPQGEAAGPTAVDQVNSPLQDGTYAGVTLGQPGVGDGKTCPLYDGINDYTDVYSLTFDGVFNGAEGTIVCWARVSAVGVWTDGADRATVGIGVDGAINYVRLYKSSVNNTFRWRYAAGGVAENVIIGALADVDWMPIAMTWSAAADQVVAYKDGAQVGAIQTVLGVWVGALSNTRTTIGDRSTLPAMPWDGYIAHVAVWDTALTPAAILDLSVL